MSSFRFSEIRGDLLTIAEAILLLLALSAGVSALFLVFWWDSSTRHPFAEASPTELLQTCALTASSALFFLQAFRQDGLRRALVLVGGLLGCMLIREQDHFLDAISHGCWKWPALALAGGCIGYALSDLRSSVESLARLTRWRWFPVLLTGLVIVLVYSRLFGMGFLWRELIPDGSWRLAKTAMEESGELLGYMLITFTSIMVNFRERD